MRLRISEIRRHRRFIIIFDPDPDFGSRWIWRAITPFGGFAGHLDNLRIFLHLPIIDSPDLAISCDQALRQRLDPPPPPGKVRRVSIISPFFQKASTLSNDT